VTQNTAAGLGGGVLIDTGTVNATASTISHNSAEFGGGIESPFDVTVNLTDSSVNGNSADAGGGGIEISDDGFLSLRGSTVNRNSAGCNIGGGVSGGGISAGLDVFVNGEASTISGNEAGGKATAPLACFGGGIMAYEAFVTLTSTRVNANFASGYGGGILVHDNGLRLVTSTVDHNTAVLGAGGGIANVSCLVDSPVTLTGTTVAANRSTGSELDTDSGGGGYAQYGNDCGVGTTASLVATSSQFSGNTAKSSVGGGIFNVNYGPGGAGLVTLAQTPAMGLSLDDNQAGWGGGIFNFGDGAKTTLQSGAHVIHNQAFVNGGGVFNDCGATLTVNPGALIASNMPNQAFTNFGPCLL
jgi:hypothetical protein